MSAAPAAATVAARAARRGTGEAPRRVAFVIIPGFAFHAHLEGHGPLHGWGEQELARVVLVEGEGARATVRAVSPGLREEGVRAGMTVATARATAGFVEAIAWDPHVVDSEATRMAGVLLAASPLVKVVGGGAFWVGANGWRLLGGEPALVDLLEELVVSQGYEVPRVGVADTVIAARAAALHDLGSIPSGDEAEALARLPLSVLPLSDATRESLWALGIRTVGAFSALPSSQVVARFGLEAQQAHGLARGEDPRTVPSWVSGEVPGIEVDFDTPFDVVEPVLFALQGGMDALVAPHAARGFGVMRLDLELMLVQGQWSRAVRPADPCTDPRRLIEMCRAVLQDAELPSAIEGMRLSVGEVGPAVVRQEHIGFDGAQQTSRRQRTVPLDVTLVRLQSRLGSQAVRCPGTSRDHHLPEERVSWEEPDARERPGEAPPPRPPGLTVAAWRLLRPAPTIGVELAGGLPQRVHLDERWWGVRHLAGPQRVETEWWSNARGSSIRRDYWYVELANGQTLSLFHDLNTRVWHAQARLD